jgi:hypothetical protein
MAAVKLAVKLVIAPRSKFMLEDMDDMQMDMPAPPPPPPPPQVNMSIAFTHVHWFIQFGRFLVFLSLYHSQEIDTAMHEPFKHSSTYTYERILHGILSPARACILGEGL